MKTVVLSSLLKTYVKVVADGEGNDATMEQPRVTVRSKMSNKQEEKKETLSTGNPFKQDKHKDWKKEKDFKEGYLFQEDI